MAVALGVIVLGAGTLLGPGPANGAETTSNALEWHGDITPLWQRWDLREHELSGNADIDIREKKTPHGPVLVGEATIRGGRYENRVLGTVIAGLDLIVVGTGKKNARVVISGTDGDAGTLQGNGTLSPGRRVPITLNGDVMFSDFWLVKRDDLRLKGNGRLAYRGDLQKGQLTGEITTSFVEFLMPKPLPAKVADLTVEEVGKTTDHGDGRASRIASDKGAVGVDVKVIIPKNAYLRGGGLDSQWEGELRIQGTFEQPRLSGGLRSVDGYFRFAGVKFVIRAGRLDFAGREPVDPIVDIVTERKTNDLTAILSASGSASRVVLSLGSNPSLPEEEILARVMFDRSVTRLASYQAQQLAAALKALDQGRTINLDEYAYAKRLLGIDVIATEKARGRGSGAPRKADAADDGSDTISLEISPGVSVESQQKEDSLGPGRLGIQWKWDY